MKNTVLPHSPHKIPDMSGDSSKNFFLMCNYLKLLMLIAGGELIIMLTFVGLGWSRSMDPVVLAVLDPLLLSLILSVPIYRWVVLPLRAHLDVAHDELHLLATATNQSGEAVIITDRHGRIEFANTVFFL